MVYRCNAVMVGERLAGKHRPHARYADPTLTQSLYRRSQTTREVLRTETVNRQLDQRNPINAAHNITLLCPRPRRGGGGIRRSSASVVRPSIRPSV